MFTETLRKRLQGIAELDGPQLSALEAHYNLMVRWNKALNLTKITAEDEAIDRHYVESLFLCSRLPSGNLRIADVGSGPGFPGFPVAILRPDCDVALIESHQRKAVFLKEASRGLKNCRIIPKRAEAVQERFDWVISRAVSYDDLRPSLSELAPNVALLTGIEMPPLDWPCTWAEPSSVPGGTVRFLRIGAWLP